MKKLIAGMLSAALLVSTTTLTAFAYAEDDTQESTEAAITEPSVSSSEALTPDGNLTLVDDIGPVTGEGQQFITLVTKAGNTFYLVIDRNDKGEETVHFMNLVDEADLLALMDEEEAAKYQEAVVTEPVVTEEPQETTEPEPEEETESEKESSSIPFLLLLLAGIGAVGGFLYFKVNGGKKPDKPAAADPDIGYEDEEDEIDLPDDEDIDDSDDEEIDDSYVDADYDKEENE